MKKIYLYGIYIIIILLMTGCHSEKISYDWLPEAKEKNEILLYDRFDQRLVTYNLVTNLVTCKNSELNYFQFEFEDNPFANIYTVGHSIYNHYKIIELENGKINTLYLMGDSEAIFPLAYKDDDELLFIKSYYGPKGNELDDNRIICYFNKKEKKLTEFKNTKGKLICKGCYLNNYLYYTVYIAKNNYQLFKLDVQNMENTPEIVMDNLQSPDLYIYNNNVWDSDKKNIYIKNIPFPKKTLNYIYKNYLIQLGPNGDSELTLYVVNINSNKKELQTTGVVDFKTKKNLLYIYTNKGIEKLELM